MLIDTLLALRPEQRGPLQELDAATVFDVSDVARYFASTHPPYEQEVEFADIRAALPDVAPLGPNMWMEYRTPWGYRGVQLVAHEHAHIPRHHHLWAKMDELGARWAYMVCGAEHDLSEPRGPALFLQGLLFLVSGNGELVHYDIFDGRTWPEMTYLRGPNANEEVDGHFCFTAHVALLAICFAHCKNVKTVERQQPRQQRRARERQGGLPLVTYKTLEIGPMTRVLRTQGGSEKNGLPRALHNCRGHWATYTKERPLFGKYTGRYWIPEHARGSKEAGLALKDYRVLTEPTKTS